MDSQVTFDDDGTPIYDRAVTSEPLRNLIKKLMTNGVLPNPSTNLQVTPGEGMTVVVLPGFANVEGELALETTSRTLAVQAPETQPRIDTVVLRLNTNTDVRTCDLYVVSGTASSSPQRPELTRTASVYEIGLADVFVAANTSTITSARITDTRLETERCGYISAIAEFDTTTLYDQIQSDLADFKENNEASFIAWVESLQDILDEETAGHLQLEIEALQDNQGDLDDLVTPTKTDLVSAINEAYNHGSDKLVLTQTLTAGQTTLTFTNAAITDSALIDIYVDHAQTEPTDVDDSTPGQIVILFDVQQTNMGVKLVIS